jgi:phosphoenolpyruvate carboxykinase (GTP)
MDFRGMDISREQFERLTRIDAELWRKEIESHGELFEQLKSRLPREMVLKRELMKLDLWRDAA